MTEGARLRELPREVSDVFEQLDDLVVVPVIAKDADELAGRALDVRLRGLRCTAREHVRLRRAQPSLGSELEQAVEDRLRECAIADAVHRDLGGFAEEVEVAARRLREAEKAIDEGPSARAALQLRELCEKRSVRRIVRERAGVSRLGSIGISAAVAVPHCDRLLEIAGEGRRQIAAVMNERRQCDRQRVPPGREGRRLLDRVRELRLEHVPSARGFDEGAGCRVPAAGTTGDPDHRLRSLEVCLVLVCNVHEGVERRA